MAYFAIEDLNGNGRGDFVVLSGKPARLEIADGSNGAPLLTIPLDAKFRVVTAVASERAGRPVIAVLMQHRTEGHVRVYEYDAVTGERLARVRYNPNYRPLAFIAQGEQSGERRYAVLGVNEDPALPSKLGRKIEIRSTDMAYVQDVWLGKYLDVLDAVAFEDGTGASRIAVLRRNADEGWLDIAIVDPVSGETVQLLPFDGNIVPKDFEPTEDIDQTCRRSSRLPAPGWPTASSACRPATSPRAASCTTRGCRGRRRSRISCTCPPAVACPHPSLGLVVRDNASSNRYRVFLVDLLTGTKTGPLEYAF